MATHKLRTWSRHGNPTLDYKINILTPLGAIAAHPEKCGSLLSACAHVDELLTLNPPLSYDRVRREMVRDGVSTSVLKVANYAGHKGETTLIVLIAPIQPIF